MQRFKNISIPYATILLAGANTVLYFLVIYDSGHFSEFNPALLLNWGANFDCLVIGGEWWRLLTACFLHGSFLHFISNFFALLIIGYDLEKIIKWHRLIIVYFLCGIFSNLLSITLNDFVVSVGASGAIFGFCGLLIPLLLAFPDLSGNAVGYVLMMMLFVTLNLLYGAYAGYIDNPAHLGGLIAGIAIFPFMKLDIASKISRFGGTGLAVIVFGAFSFALFHYLPKNNFLYYSAFLEITQNDNHAKSLQMSKGYFVNPPLFYKKLEKANDLWNENIKLLNSVSWISDNKISEDVNMLKQYTNLRMQGTEILKKGIKEKTYVSLDKFYNHNQKIYDLPFLNYPLDFSLNDPPGKTEDTLIKVRVYFTQEWIETNDLSKAYYYRNARVDKLNRYQGWVYDYYSNGMIKMKGFYENNLMNGPFFYFYDNGEYEASGMMDEHSRLGDWETFYMNGQKKEDIFYYKTGFELINYWDSSGIPMVREGNGIFVSYYNPERIMMDSGLYVGGLKHSIWHGYSKNGKLMYVEDYKMGVIRSGISFNQFGSPFSYNIEYISPQPFIGWEKYIKSISDSLRYPPMAKADGTEGIQIIEIYVTETGEILSYEPLTRLGNGCEEEAIRLIKQDRRFLPAFHRGIAEAGRAKVYVEFKFK